MTSGDTARKKQIFVSYSRADEYWLGELAPHLKGLEREGDTEFWIDKDRLRPGEMWTEKLQNAIDAADGAVLLVSARYFSSDFIWEHELPALVRAAERGCRLLVIEAGQWDVERTPLGKIQLVGSRPLEGMSKGDYERVFQDLLTEIRKMPPPAASSGTAGKASAPKHDVFVAVPMVSAGTNRDSVGVVAGEIVRAFENCGLTTYCAELLIKVPGGTDIPQVAVKTLDILKASRYFVMYYPLKWPSSVLFEAGIAVALDKPSVYFVRKADHLPFMMDTAKSAMNLIHVHTFTRPEEIPVLIANNCGDLFKVYGSPL